MKLYTFKPFWYQVEPTSSRCLEGKADRRYLSIGGLMQLRGWPREPITVEGQATLSQNVCYHRALQKSQNT